MKAPPRAGVIAALVAVLLSCPSHAAAQGAPASTSAQAGTDLTSLSPAFAGSKAGVFVLSFVAPGTDPAAAAQALRDLTTTHAGIAAAIVGDKDSPGVTRIDDPSGQTSTRFNATSGETIALTSAGTEIARFPAGTSAAVIGERIEKSRAAPTREYNIPAKTALALEGFDPTSYFEAPKPFKGDAKITSRYRGVLYRFATDAARARFNADPEKYIPTYGGWCATAMAEGDKVEVDPTNYKITRGRLFLFYKGFLGNARNDWDKNENTLEKNADRSWSKFEK